MKYIEKRDSYDEAIKVIFTNKEFNQYLFYVHILSQCRLEFSDIDFIAGVSISDYKYILHINSEKFGNLPIKQRIGVLKHEVLHIIDLHLTDRKAENHKKWNLATDCAINQLIEIGHLPENHITVENLFKNNKNIKRKERAEYYYNLIEDEEDEEDNKKDYSQFDIFSKEDSTDCGQIKDITEGMINSAIEETIKTSGVGSIPNEVKNILKLKYSKEINWKRQLQRIVGSIKTNTKRTIMKSNRRNPSRKDLKGKIKDVKYEILVITDESGSVSDKQEQIALSEILSLCNMIDSPVDLIRVDTKASDITILTKKSLQYTRIKSGGTYLSDSIEKIKKNYDIIIILSDGELSKNDIDNFYQLNKDILWLIINESDIDGLVKGKMKMIQIRNIKESK